MMAVCEVHANKYFLLTFLLDREIFMQVVEDPSRLRKPNSQRLCSKLRFPHSKLLCHSRRPWIPSKVLP